MNNKALATLGISVVIMVLLGIGSNLLAEPPRPGAEGEVSTRGEMAVAGTVRSGFSYQGRLTDKNTGASLDGQYDMLFQFWNAVMDGNQVGSDVAVNDVDVEDGLFNVTIDVPDEFFDGTALWLRVKVGDEWLDPRREILPVPYALSLMPGASIQGEVTCDVISAINTNTTGGANGVYGESSSPNGAGINGYNTSTTGGWGVLGQTHGSSGDGAGVAGTSHATTGDSHGVRGQANSPGAAGVSGYNSATTGGWGVLGQTQAVSGNGAGVAGTSHATTGYNDGIRGEANSPGASGVAGFNNATTGGWGVFGHSSAPNGVGVVGINDATTDWALGVLGETHSSEGMAVMGVNYATTGWARGVNGESFSPDGIGVAGIHNNGGIGVYASSITGTALYVKSDSGKLIHAVSVNGADTEFYVSNDGNVYADGTYSSPAADFAEMLPAHNDLEPGDVLVVDLDGKLTHSTLAYQTAVVGVYSTKPGFLGGAGDDADLTGKVPLAIIGVVPVKVSAENGPIFPGALLTSSTTDGHAMMCNNRLDCIGAIIGKALEPLEGGTGVILVLVTLQ